MVVLVAQLKRVTIKEVALQAGVSTQTVSRVLNDRPDVSPETRASIHAVIDRLGYAPNAIARSLIQGRSSTLGVVAAALEYYGPAHILTGIEHQANALGYSLFLCLLHAPAADQGQALVHSLLAHQVEGILWAAPEIGSSSAWLKEKMGQFSTPVIFINTQADTRLASASIDNLEGGGQAARHLLDQGYRHLAALGGPCSWFEATQRLAGWREALRAAGFPSEEHPVVCGDWSAESGESAMRQLLQVYPEVDAVFACNDQMALGALKAARQCGRRVPQDLGVVGFDDIPEASFFDPSLTTIRQPLNALGAQAVLELHRLIETRRQGTDNPPTSSHLLPVELVVRQSSLKNSRLLTTHKKRETDS